MGTLQEAFSPRTCSAHFFGKGAEGKRSQGRGGGGVVSATASQLCLWSPLARGHRR